MSAAYDRYDYPGYWKNRTYEHESEILALKSLLQKIPSVNSIVDVGSGFGRHTPTYAYRAKKITLVDPSAKLLKLAKEKLQTYKVKYIQSRLETLHEKIKNKKFDLAIFIRVIHHINDLDIALDCLDQIIEPGGYLIMEFANKVHWKEVIRNFLKGDFTYPLDIFPKDKRSQQSIDSGSIPFLNLHPDMVEQELLNRHYKIIDILSVSNVRSTFLKRKLPYFILMYFESLFQHPLAFFHFGPSIFLLARKARITG